MDKPFLIPTNFFACVPLEILAYSRENYLGFIYRPDGLSQVCLNALHDVFLKIRRGGPMVHEPFVHSLKAHLLEPVFSNGPGIFTLNTMDQAAS